MNFLWSLYNSSAYYYYYMILLQSINEATSMSTAIGTIQNYFYTYFYTSHRLISPHARYTLQPLRAKAFPRNRGFISRYGFRYHPPCVRVLLFSGKLNDHTMYLLVVGSSCLLLCVISTQQVEQVDLLLGIGPDSKGNA